MLGPVNFMRPLRLINLYFLISAGDKMQSLVRNSSLVRCKGFTKPAPGSQPGLRNISIYQFKKKNIIMVIKNIQIK